MPNQEPPQTIDVPFGSLTQLATEAWRLAKWLAPLAGSSGCAPARYSLRRIEDLLKQNEFEARDLDGHAYDAGMAAEVVEVIEDPTLPEGEGTISETVSPLVLWRGTVVQAATVAIRKGTRS